VSGNPEYSDILAFKDGHCTFTRKVVERCPKTEATPFSDIVKHLYRQHSELMISVTETTLGPSELSEITIC